MMPRLMMNAPKPKPRTPNVIRELERLPAEPTAALRVLMIADDTNSSADDLGAVVAADPALTTRLMRMANSAFYGLSGRVRSCAFAVTVLGFSTVRSVAAATAAGALEENVTLPPGFWLHAATVATASGVVAPRAGSRHTEAFSLGLLHDLGSFLLSRTDPEGYAAMADEHGEDNRDVVSAEHFKYGADHAAVAAQVLKAWHFPDDFVDALARHHEAPSTIKSALARSLVGGEALARVAMVEATGVEARYAAEAAMAEELAEALALVRIEPSEVSPLAAQARRGGEQLAASFNAM